MLCENSGADVEWLMDKFNLDLSLVPRLGGHSAPRTHRGKELVPGMTITCALLQMVEKIAVRSDKARIITDGACTGCIYEKGADLKEFGPVIFASGGFGADFTNNSLLAQYRQICCTFRQRTVNIALVSKKHRPRVGPGAPNRLGEARSLRCQNQVPRSGSATRSWWSCLRRTRKQLCQ